MDFAIGRSGPRLGKFHLGYIFQADMVIFSSGEGPISTLEFDHRQQECRDLQDRAPSPERQKKSIAANGGIYVT